MMTASIGAGRFDYRHMSVVALLVLTLVCPAAAQDRRGQSLRLLSGCEIDLNGDGQRDMAMSLMTSGTRKVVVLLAKGKSYETFVLTTGYPAGMVLKCTRGTIVRETTLALRPGEKPR